MKILTLIVHTNVQQKLSDLLRSMDQVSGFTFTHVEGHGAETEKDSFLAAHDEAIGFIPRVRTDLLLQDADVESVLQKISDAEFDIQGQGVYWVIPVEKGGRLL
jgi:nitrogen regulatory protein P-II 1